MAAVQKVAVIGAGIIGLSSAVLVQEQIPNIEITVISEKFSPNTTGDGSAGLWHPYLLGDDVSDKALRFWCDKTFQFLQDIYLTSEANEHGVGLYSCYRLSSTPLETPSYHDMFLEWRPMNKKELSLFPNKYRYGAFLTTYYAECRKLLPMLLKRFKNNGGKVIQKKVDSLSELAGKYDLVINCTGLGAARLTADPTVKPIRGQVFRVRAPWVKHGVLADDDFYILLNSEDLVCGGTHQKDDWNLSVDPKDSKKIWEGCTELIPSLKKAEILSEWVGLRPGRSQPRLEQEILKTSNGSLEVIHNYGHGGSGVTLFWGCAHHVLQLVKESIGNQLQSRL